MRAVAFYCLLYKLAVKSCIQYRADFVIGIVTSIARQLAALSFYTVIFSRTSAIGGWSGSQVLLLFGVTALVLGISELLLNGIWWVPSYIVQGEMDRILLYPVRSLVFVLTMRPEFYALGNIFVGATIVAQSWCELALPGWVLLLLPVWVACGALIYTAALVLMACICFVVVGSSSYHLSFVQNLLDAARYPVSIYPAWIRILLLIIVPLAVPIYFPARWLFGSANVVAGLLLPPAVAALCVWGTFTIWTRSVRFYHSTGS